MRSIKLADILGKKVDDDDILKALAPQISLPPAIRGKILLSYTEYRLKKGSNSIPALGLNAPWPDKFSALYTGRSQVSGLSWIDTIANTTLYGYCPMCGSETHKTVDHFLPRKPWAEFSFLSLNLVPSCGTCNGKRGNRANAPHSPHRALHPFYDHRLLKQRLHITKISPPYAAPKFEAEVCTSVSAKSRPRVTHHLDQSIDEVEYQQFCNNRWSELRQQVRRTSTIAKWKKVIREHCDDAIATSGPNSWRTAFFDGILKNRDAVQWLFDNRAKA